MRSGNYYSRGGGKNNNGNSHRGGGSGGGNTHHGRGGAHGSDDRDQKEKKKRDAIFDLKKFTDKRIRVKFMGGREVTGVLKGSDQLLNIVLDDAEETLRDPENPDSMDEERKRHIGLVVLRGPSIILVSPTDGSEEIENPFVQAE